MNWKIKFKEKLYDELEDYLFSNSPKENGCFVLGKVKNKVLFITDIYYPDDEKWIKKERDLCVPSPFYISKACVLANNENKALIFIHSHPEKNHPSVFSDVDLESNSKLFTNLKNILVNEIGSFVFSLKGINGVIFSKNKIEKIDSYSVIGERMRLIKDASSVSCSLDDKEFNRQALFMKNKGLNLLSDIEIAIVGLGGIGSPLAIMLAKMGVRNFSFYDFDRVEIHNLPRIYGATRSDIGKYKIDVVKKHILTFAEDCSIINNYDKIDINTDLSKHDLIFGSVDNHTARDLLNKVSYEFSIPYIDSACAIPMSLDTDAVQSSVISVNTVLLNRPCLWCSEVLDAMQIMEESLTDEEKEVRVNDGYLKGVETAPSVITLTTSVATFAINRFLNLWGILPGNFPNKMIFDFSNNMYLEPDVNIKEKCTCQKLNPFT